MLFSSWCQFLFHLGPTLLILTDNSVVIKGFSVFLATLCHPEYIHTFGAVCKPSPRVCTSPFVLCAWLGCKLSPAKKKKKQTKENPMNHKTLTKTTRFRFAFLLPLARSVGKRKDLHQLVNLSQLWGVGFNPSIDHSQMGPWILLHFPCQHIWQMTLADEISCLCRLPQKLTLTFDLWHFLTNGVGRCQTDLR